MRKPGVTDTTPKVTQGRGLTAIKKQVIRQYQKLLLFVYSKDLKQVG